jgi:hypothetical protein
MSAAGGGGLGDVTTVNLGYLHTDDAGRYGPTFVGGLQTPNTNYDRASTPCSLVEDINLCTGLRNFLAANGNLAGTLDFTGCADLEFIECYNAFTTGVTLTGCTSLIRLCLEHNNLGTLDITPVVGNLYDLRAAVQRGGTLNLVTGGQVLTNLYHLCIRDSIVTGIPTTAQLPVVYELWIWGTHFSGALVVNSPVITSVSAYNNLDLTSLVVTGPIAADRWVGIHMYNCGLTSVDLTDCAGIRNIDVRDNSLDAAAIDGLLVEVESWGTIGPRTIDTTGNTPPSATGLAAAETLIGRGWTVTTDALAPELNITRNSVAVADAGTDSVSGTVAGSATILTYVLTNGGTSALTVTVPVTTGNTNNCAATVTTQPATSIAAAGTSNLVVSVTPTVAGAWSFTVSIDNTDSNENPYNWTVSGTTVVAGGVNYDDFERPDVTGIANVGNGWYSVGSATANIVSGALVRPDTAAYRQILNPGVNLPADYSVTVSIPHATRGTYKGLTGRWNGTNGVRVLWPEPHVITIGDASGWQSNNVTVNIDADYPASWDVNQDHTITMKMTGTLIEIFIDGQPTRGFYATVTTNATLTNTAYGICGEGQSRVWYSIGTTQP